MTAQIAATASSPWAGAVWSSLRLSGIGDFRRFPLISDRHGHHGLFVTPNVWNESTARPLPRYGIEV
jgi:hypothetical protein